MKTTNKILALVLMTVAMVFASCSKDDDNNPVVPTQQEIEAKIVGKWKKISQGGVPVPTNLRSVFSFSNNGKGTASRSAQGLTGYIWSNKIETKYSVTGNILHIVNDIEFFDKVSNISADTFSAHEKQIIGDKAIESEVTRQRVYADYSQDIIGMWEGVEITGYETYGNAEHRILYNADGTYVYFVKSGDAWVPSSNVDNEYNVDGDWLATRWRPEAGSDYNYEWWDIDEIKDGIMKWSALREKEDGTRFNTTFTWKKIERPSQQEIEEKLVGKWKTIGKDGYDCLTNDRSVFTYNYDGTCCSSISSYSEALSQYLWDNKVDGTYNVSGNAITRMIKAGTVTTLSYIYTISDDYFVEHTDKIKDGSKDIETRILFVLKKVTADYSHDILGTWEGVSMTGDETYGDYHHRIEYRADGTYTYYSWDESTQTWKPLEDVFDEWNVDGDWLATRWQNKGSDVMNYEWWDIDYIKKEGNDIIMKWSALREKEDGTRFNTTFTWKKVK